eukprot:15457884-Alexandrium_andersonii.AAC.1
MLDNAGFIDSVVNANTPQESEDLFNSLMKDMKIMDPPATTTCSTPPSAKEVMFDEAPIGGA